MRHDRDKESDRFADIPLELKEAYQREVLGIEPPTFAEKLRSFWNKYEIFVILGSVVLGAGIGGTLAWQLSESEQARKVFPQAVMTGTGILGGAVALAAINFIGSNIIVDVLTERFKKRQ